MKFWYVEIKKKDTGAIFAPSSSYRFKRAETCCDTMEKQFNRGAVHFSDGYSRVAALTVVEQIDSRDGLDLDYVEISFCPWCGEAIEAFCEKTVREVVKTQEEQITRRIQVKTYVDEVTGQKVKV